MEPHDNKYSASHDLELAYAITALFVKTFTGFKFEIEPQFNDAYLATSLQDFWGRCWNLVVSSILLHIVYNPIREVTSPVIGPSPTAPTSVVRNTIGKGKEISQENSSGSASDAAIREYCDKRYNQLLSILAEKMHQEKVQQEKLKAVKVRLNFEGVSQHFESGTPSRRRGGRKRLGSKRIRSVFGSPEPKRGRSESPRKRDSKRKMVFKRLEKDVFHRLGDKEKGMSAYLNESGISRKDTKSCYQSSRSRGTKPAFKKHHNKRASKKQRSSIEDDDLSQPWVCEETDPFTPRIRYFDLPKRTRMPSHIKTYDIKFVDNYDDLKEAFLENSLQHKKYIKDPVEIHHIKQREGESTKDFVRRFKIKSMDVKGAPEVMRISAFMHGITNPELIKRLHDKIPSGLRTRRTTFGLQSSHRRKNQGSNKPRTPRTKNNDWVHAEEGRNRLCDLLTRNLDVFAWKPADMTGVPRHVLEHRLNVREGCPSVRQKKRGQAADRNQTIQEEVKKVVDVGIMKEVHYNSWLSNPVMVKNHDGSWRMCVDFKDLNKACLKDEEEMFLGYKLNTKGIKVCPNKVDVVLSLPSPKCLKDVQKLNGKLASLNRFLGKSAKKSLPFFKTLKKRTKKSDFHWIKEAESAFKQMKQLIAKLLMLTAPAEKEELIVYLAAAKEAFTYSLRFRFEVTNNEGEYEALIAGDSETNRCKTPPSKFRFTISGQPSQRNLHSEGSRHDPIPGKGGGYMDEPDLRVPYRRDSSSQGEQDKSGATQIIAIRRDQWGHLQEIFSQTMVAGIDIARPFPKGPGKVKFLIVAIDYFTKWIEAKPVATITGNQIKKFVWDNIVCRFGLPREIISDNGKQFQDNPFKDWREKLFIPVEIGMPTLRTTEVDMVQNDEALEINLDLLEGKREHATICEVKSKAKMEKYYNSKVRNISFKPGDLVYCRNDASHAKEGGKLGPKWEGPYEVTKALGKGAYMLRDRDGKQFPRT
nr:hypothetical protein [Tanacetum cinerariifolium]